MFDRLANVTPPGSPLQVLSLDDAKAHLSITFDDHDAYITSLIAAAVDEVDGPYGIGLCLLPQTWRLSLDTRQQLENLRFPLWPVTSVTQITYVDMGGAEQTLDPGLYTVDLDTFPCRLARTYGTFWTPFRPQPGSVKVTFEAGFPLVDSVSTVPANIQHAIRLIIGHWYRNREAVVGVDNRDSSTELPLGVTRILDRYAPKIVF